MGSALPPRPSRKPRTPRVAREDRIRRSVPLDLEVFPVPRRRTLSRALSRSRSSRPLQGLHCRIRRTAIACAHALTTLEPVRVLPEFPPLRRTQHAESTFTTAFTAEAGRLAPPRCRACLTRLRSAFRVLHPLDGFLLRTPCGLVSSRSRPWGSLIRALLPIESRDASRRPLPS